MKEALTTLDVLRKERGIRAGKPELLSVAKLFASTRTGDEGHGVHFRLILENDDSFTMEYTVGDRTVAKQKQLAWK